MASTVAETMIRSSTTSMECRSFNKRENCKLADDASSYDQQENNSTSLLRVRKRVAERMNCRASPLQDLSLKLIADSREPPYHLVELRRNASSLKRLQIRIPPGARSFHANIVCPRLEELVIWVESERSKCLQIAFMRNAAEQRRKAHRKLQQHCTPGRNHRPTGVLNLGDADESSSTSSSVDELNLDGMAKFIALQPNLQRLRIQTSTLAKEQWNSLTAGINGSLSLKHLEFCRLEAAGPNDSLPLESISSHQSLQSVDLNGCPTMFNWVQLSERNSKLKRITWSSSPIQLLGLRELSQSLSMPTASLTHLEISHTSLSGHKAILIAQMLHGNTSIRDLNLSNAQLNGIDGLVLVMGLKSNTTLQRLSLNDNALLKGPCDLTFQAFKELLSIPTSNIQYLDLSRNEMEPAENDIRCAQLFDGIQKGSNLKSIKLSTKGTLFFDTLQASTSWYPSGNHHPDVCRSLGNAISHCQLTELYLDHNYLGKAAIAKFLAPALTTKSQLVKLSLKRVGMDDRALLAISKAIAGKPALKFLDISHNTAITHGGMERFAPCLTTFPALETFWFHSSRPETYVHIVAPALETQYSLRELSHEECLPVEDRVLLIANRCGRKCLYQEGGLNESIWPIILGRVSHMPRVLALFLREKADLLTCTMSRPLSKSGNTNHHQQQQQQQQCKRQRLMNPACLS
eukprot:scaffold5918_cov130-Cylindrotheca_fusiformis.AAC.3